MDLKRKKYEAKCRDRGYLFKPFVCGSLGGFCDDAVEIMKDIGKASAVVLGLTN